MVLDDKSLRSRFNSDSSNIIFLDYRILIVLRLPILFACRREKSVVPLPLPRSIRLRTHFKNLLQYNWLTNCDNFYCTAKYLFSSVAQSCLTLCDPMNHSTPGLPVHHKLPEFTQTHAHWVGDAIQPSHPLSSPSPPAPNPSLHQGLFQWVNSLHEVARLLEFQLQHQSFQWTPRTYLLQDGLVGSPCNPRDSQESSPPP